MRNTFEKLVCWILGLIYGIAIVYYSDLTVFDFRLWALMMLNLFVSGLIIADTFQSRNDSEENMVYKMVGYMFTRAKINGSTDVLRGKLNSAKVMEDDSAPFWYVEGSMKTPIFGEEDLAELLLRN